MIAAVAVYTWSEISEAQSWHGDEMDIKQTQWYI